MTRQRQYVLGGLVVAVGLVTAAILVDVFATIFFAITVAFVLVPVHRRLRSAGLSNWWSGVVATVLAFVGIAAVLSPLAFVLVRRLEEVVAFLRALPDELSVVVFEYPIVVQVSDLQDWAIEYLRHLAGGVASAAPILLVKATLFVMLVFALLLNYREVRRATIAPVPREYRPIAESLLGRARDTLYALYVLQAATAVATFVVALALFVALGYDQPLTLATIAAILQFVPIVGPSLLVLALVVTHLAAGELGAAALVGVLGFALIAWLPDVLVRPRLARHTAGLPGALYFVGFTGGVLSLGPVGIIAGPLVVAVFVESVELLAADVNGELPATNVDGDPAAVDRAGEAAATAGGAAALDTDEVSGSEDATFIESAGDDATEPDHDAVGGTTQSDVDPSGGPTSAN